MENNNGKRTENRITSLERCMEYLKSELVEIKDEIKSLKTNDLYHLNQKLDRLTWFFVITIVGLATNIVLRFID